MMLSAVGGSTTGTTRCTPMLSFIEPLTSLNFGTFICAKDNSSTKNAIRSVAMSAKVAIQAGAPPPAHLGHSTGGSSSGGSGGGPSSTSSSGASGAAASGSGVSVASDSTASGTSPSGVSTLTLSSSATTTLSGSLSYRPRSLQYGDFGRGLSQYRWCRVGACQQTPRFAHCHPQGWLSSAKNRRWMRREPRTNPSWI